MYPLGHVGFALAGATLARRVPALASLARLPWAWLAAGALLPDLLDKPLGQLALDWGTGRLWGHSLLFVLALALAAAAAARAAPPAAPALAALALGTGTHLLLDAMWAHPRVLLWPLLGPMPHGTLTLADWWTRLLRDPAVWAGETLGAVGIAWALGERRRSRR